MLKPSADEDVEKIGPFHIIDGNINYSVAMEIYVRVLKSLITDNVIHIYHSCTSEEINVTIHNYTTIVRLS